MTAATIAVPGDGPLFGTDSPFAPHALLPHLRAREAARLETVLAAIEARDLERGWGNPSLRSGFAALSAHDREHLLLAPDFRRWLARLLWSSDPRAGTDATLPVQAQAIWNQLAIPWLRSPESERSSLWLLVHAGGQVPFPGSGLALAAKVEGRKVGLRAAGEELRFETERGDELIEASRRELLAAWDGGPAPPGFSAAARLAGTAIEVAGEADTAMDEALGAAARRLAAAWPAGNSLLCGLVHRLQLDPDPELNSKTESELPGVIFLGRHQTDSTSIAELLVHEAAHLLVYEVALLAPILPAPHEVRRSPFSREGNRPAYMVLHGTVSFLAQAIATLRLNSDSAGIGERLRTELARLRTGAQELRTHLVAHGETPHPFITALFGELALLGEAIGE